MKNPYTLLADANQPMSVNEHLVGNFKAHLVYSLIFNDRLAISDNQAISSRNLRKLASSDGVVRECFKERFFDLAIRQGLNKEQPEEVVELSSLQQMFLEEGKISLPDTQ